MIRDDPVFLQSTEQRLIHVYLLLKSALFAFNETLERHTCHVLNRQVAQLSQRDCTARWVSYGQKWKTIFCRQYRSIFNHCDVRGLQSYQIRLNKAKSMFVNVLNNKSGVKMFTRVHWENLKAICNMSSQDER